MSGERFSGIFDKDDSSPNRFGGSCGKSPHRPASCPFNSAMALILSEA
jgi:hypothetical protein